MRISGVAICLAIAAHLLLAGCSDPCNNGSGNANFPTPTVSQFQLVINNSISRNTPVYVNGALVGTVCSDTANVVVGNFDTALCTALSVYNEVDACTWKFTSCSTFKGLMCEDACTPAGQKPDYCIDTTVSAGTVKKINLCFEDQCPPDA
jgi:hypothetical protein